MLEFTVVLLFLCLLYLVRENRKYKRFVQNWNGAVQGRKTILVERKSHLIEGEEDLTGEWNRLVEQYRKYSSVNDETQIQSKAILGSLHEAVLLVNASRRVVLSNNAADSIFNKGKSLKGVRLEERIKSSRLLEICSQAYGEQYENIHDEALSIEVVGEDYWFEVDANLIRAAESEVLLIVLHDITDLKNLEEVRKEFVANASHELRTPITIIRGFAETLANDPEMDITQRSNFMEKIVRNTNRLYLIVEDMLQLTRIEAAGDSTLNRSKKNINGIADEVIDDFRKRYEHIQFDTELDDAVPLTLLDEEKVTQVFVNLIENAVTHGAPAVSSITIYSEYLDNGSICCKIIDDGTGIPDRDLGHVFERFYQVDKGRSKTEKKGTGLGLSIVKHIIEEHGGSIYVNSSQGEGTVFTILMPFNSNDMHERT